MNALTLDVRYAIRGLLAHPGLTIAVVTCLALGIGVNATMLQVVHDLLFRAPAHVQDPHRVVRVLMSYEIQGSARFTSAVSSFPSYNDLARAARSFSGIGAFSCTSVTLGGGVDALQARACLATASLFPLLGVRAALGRFYLDDEDHEARAGRVLVLGYGLWRRAFGGNGSAIGSTVRINAHSYTVVGIAPDGFTGVDVTPVDVWLPLRASLEELRGAGLLHNRGSALINIVARLGTGVHIADATRDATRVLRRANGTERNGDTSVVVALGPVQRERGPTASQSTRVAEWVGAASVLVLLVACANVASLLLARAATRRREIAVRLALGAPRRRLAEQLLVESGLLAFLGGGASLLLAMWAQAVVRSGFRLPPPSSTLACDTRLLVITGVLALVSGVLCGAPPALQATGPNAFLALKGGAQVGTRGRTRIHAALVVMQVALTLVLLTSTGLLLRSLAKIRALPVGFEPWKVVVAAPDLAGAGYKRPAIDALYEQVLGRVRTLPGVRQAAVSTAVPLQSASGISYAVPGQQSVPGALKRPAFLSAVTPGYFETLGTTVLLGRTFTDADGVGAPRVAVVNETMARYYWPAMSPLGGCIRAWSGAGPCIEVIGVVADAQVTSLREDPTPEWFTPLAQDPMAEASGIHVQRALMVRAKGNPGALAADVRRAFYALAPDLPFIEVRTLADIVDWEVHPLLRGSVMFATFGGIAMILAVVGLYGLISFTVTQRTSELGIRMALGACARDIVFAVVRDGVRLTLLGLFLGGLAVLAIGRAIGALLYGVAPTDPLSIGSAAVVLLSAATIASYLPARRATRLRPTLALRAE